MSYKKWEHINIEKNNLPTIFGKLLHKCKFPKCYLQICLCIEIKKNKLFKIFKIFINLKKKL